MSPNLYFGLIKVFVNLYTMKMIKGIKIMGINIMEINMMGV
jgi:hypothetical protein